MIEHKAKPAGLKKWLFHAPSYVYRAHLGGVFGKRFLMIEHMGRTSGKVYFTVLEVAGHYPQTNEWISTAGWGPRTDWYRNLRANGVEAVWIGSSRHTADVRFLEPEEAAPVMKTYELKYPKTAAKLRDVMGVDFDGTDEGRIKMMDQIPMVAFSVG